MRGSTGHCFQRVFENVRNLLLAIAILFTGFSSIAGATQFGDIRIEVTPQPTIEGYANRTRPGYMEYRITLTNSSKTQARRVLISHYSNGDFSESLKNNTRTIEAPPLTTLTVPLFQPVNLVATGPLHIEIDGEKMEERVFLNGIPKRSSGSILSGGFRYSVSILVGRDISEDLRDEVRAAFPDTIAFYRSEIPASQWSPNWLGYTGYDAVLISPREAASLSLAVKIALRRYVETGGNLIIQGAGTQVNFQLPSDLVGADEIGEFNSLVEVGLGAVMLLDAPVEGVTELVGRFRRWQLSSIDGVFNTNDRNRVPVRMLMVLICLFAIVIGPLNLFLLWRSNRRVWLWWTVPAISFASCLLIFGYSLISEGIRAESQTKVVTWLNAKTLRATTIAAMNFYSPLTPRDGLHFSYDTIVQVPIEEDSYPRRQRRGRAKSINWTSDQHLYSGWINSRTSLDVGLRKSETRQERLVFSRATEGKIKVVNGLGTDVNQLYFKDADEKLYYVETVTAGAEATMRSADISSDKEPETYRAANGFGDLTNKFAVNDFIEAALQSPSQLLKKNEYLAATNHSPFLENPLKGAVNKSYDGLIIGTGVEVNDGR